MTINRKKYFILTINALLISCAVIFFIHGKRSRQDHEGQVFLKAVAVPTARGWGYNIMADDKIYIHQDYIPAAEGKRVFKTKEDAMRVANRVIEKISKNQLPVITLMDLDSLGVLK